MSRSLRFIIQLGLKLPSCLLTANSRPGHALQAYIYLSLQLLVTACPCALILSTPVTVCRWARIAVCCSDRGGCGVLVQLLRRRFCSSMDCCHHFAAWLCHAADLHGCC